MSNKVRPLFLASLMILSVILIAPTAQAADSDNDGVDDADDAFPNDSNEWNDTDGDGVGDNSDAFPEDPDESEDFDGDGVGDNSDCEPEDSAVTYTNNPVSCSGFTELSYPYVAQAGSSDPPGLYDVHFAVLETSGNECTECSNEEIDLMSSSGTLDIGIMNEFQNWSDQHEFVEFYFQYIDDNRNEQYDSGEIYVISCESSTTQGHIVIADGRIYAYDYEEFWPDAYGINIVNEDDDEEPEPDTDGDGYLDEDDAFPEDSNEWEDSDGDGVGDNSDCDPYDSSVTSTNEELCMVVGLKDFDESPAGCDGEHEDEGSDCWNGYLRADKNEVKIVLKNLDDALEYTLNITDSEYESGGSNQVFHYTAFQYLVTEEGHQEMYEERVHINSDEPQFICSRNLEITLSYFDPNDQDNDSHQVQYWQDVNYYGCESRPQPQAMLKHADGGEIKENSPDELFTQGASVELSFEVHNLKNDTNYSLQWRATDEMNDAGQMQMSYFHNETLESISSNNSDGTYEHYWTLNIPSDSCLVDIEYVLTELDYDGFNEKHGMVDVLICDWLVTSRTGEDTFTSEAFLNLDTQGLVLNINDNYGLWTHYYVDYVTGNRDKILTQTEFDSYFEMFTEEGDDDCISAEIGNAWTMNGQLIEKDHSYCEYAFDDNGTQFSAYVLLNGSWQADANGEWVLEIYTGDIYSDCTIVTSNSSAAEQFQGMFKCVSDELESNYYDNDGGDFEDSCQVNNDTGKWSCKYYWQHSEEPPTEYDSCERETYDEDDWVQFECQNEGQYRINHYQQDQCNPSDGVFYCKHPSDPWETNYGDENTCVWNADPMYWECDNGSWWRYCEMQHADAADSNNSERIWYCTDIFGSDESFGNTTGNSHFSDETVPSEADLQTVRYGVTSSDSFDLINAKFVRDDGVSLMMAVSSGSAYVDIPYDWDQMERGRFVWKAVSDDSSNGTDDSNNTSTENRLPVCDVFAVSNVGASGQIAASDIASKLAGNTALTAPLTGTLTVPLTAGSYEFMVDCTDPDGDDLVISINDGITTVTAEAMDGHFYGGLGFIVKEESTFTYEVTVTWTDGTESGEVKVTFDAVMGTPEPDETASTSGLPGFTAPLSMLALLGAAMLLGRHKKEE
jgi:hypothetical protein